MFNETGNTRTHTRKCSGIRVWVWVRYKALLPVVGVQVGPEVGLLLGLKVGILVGLKGVRRF